jgi:acetyltransferase-like isoleucine patch superfamily enzyme
MQYAHKWRWYRRADRPWARIALHAELARRECFARGRMFGEPLQMMREGRLQLGTQTFFEDGVWLTSHAGRIEIGANCILNRNVMVAASELVQIGDFTLIGNGCLITDSSHRNDDVEEPMPWQGYVSKGPTRIGDNTWIGVNSVITSGVTVGRRCAIGANSVVTRDVPDFSLVAGSPARVIRSLRA